MNKSIGIALLVIGIIIFIAGWFIFTTPRAVAPTSSTPQGTVLDQNTTAPETSASASANVNVQYSASSGFSPSIITIKQGGTVTFTSTDGSPMWIASNAHPTHIEYSGTSRTEHCPDTLGVAFDECAPGSTYTFKFLKAGSWGYHNHMSPNMLGTVVVQ